MSEIMQLLGEARRAIEEYKRKENDLFDSDGQTRFPQAEHLGYSASPPL